MNSQRTHHSITSDGVTLGESVHGQGPPLVLLHGIESDGRLCWQEVLPHLAERFTCHLLCHLLDNRGRGLSGAHPDPSIPRLGRDAGEDAASLGQPVGLVRQRRRDRRGRPRWLKPSPSSSRSHGSQAGRNAQACGPDSGGEDGFPDEQR